MLLDTASLYFRAYYGVPDTFTAPDGTPVNAVRGLLDFVARLVNDRFPTTVVACWDDDWRPAFRVAAIPSYKAHRVADDSGTDAEEVPDTLAPQVPVIRAMLDALGIPIVGAPGHEADDVIGTLAARSAGPVDIVTGDRDLFQCVDDARGVRVLYTARGVSRAEVVDNAVVLERYGVPAAGYAAFAALRGDPSDGLPGVKGVGEKTAAALVTAYGGIPDVIAAARDASTPMRPAVRAGILAALDYLAVAPRVVEVVGDLPLPDVVATLADVPADPDALAVLVERWGVASPVERVLAAAGRAAQATEE